MSEDIYACILDDDIIIPYDEEEIKEALREVELIEVRPVATKHRKMSDEYKAARNIMVKEIREDLMTPLFDNDFDTLSVPILSTITLSGDLKGVQFNEEEIIEKLEPDDDIVFITCNYGTKASPAYRPPPPKVKKPKPAAKKERKKQGDGSAFNSQFTFNIPTITDGEYKEYKFKIFRNGKIELPGARPDLLDEIVGKLPIITKKLNDVLHPTTPGVVTVCNIIPVMINYKFFARIKEDEFVDMMMLKMILLAQMAADNNTVPEKLPIIMCLSENETTLMFTGAADELNINKVYGDLVSDPIDHPVITDVIYTTEDSKLALIFSTPVEHNPNKHIRVNFFKRGRINILGGHDKEFTIAIHQFIMRIFDLYYDHLIVSQYGREAEYEFIPRDEIPDFIFDTAEEVTAIMGALIDTDERRNALALIDWLS